MRNTLPRYIKAEICSIRDLSKRWYIYYYHLKPGSSEYQFFKEYKGINRYKTKNDRLLAARAARDARNELLAEGWSPFKEHTVEEFMEVPNASASQSLNKILNYKQSYLKRTGFISARSRIQNFITYLESLNLASCPITIIDQETIRRYLQSLKTERNLSNRARNNHLTELNSCFQLLLKYQYVQANPCQFLDKEPEHSEIHRPFSDSELAQLVEYLKANDPYLLQFCRFVCYAFLRTTEIVNLRVGDINASNNTLSIQSKTGFIQKPILNQLWPTLEAMEYHQYPKEYYLFSAQGKPTAAGTSRDYFSKRFTAAKRALGFSHFYTLYGLRHTFVQQLLRNGATDRQVMSLTGHRSMAAFEAYKRNLELKEPKGADLSQFFSNNL